MASGFNSKQWHTTPLTLFLFQRNRRFQGRRPGTTSTGGESPRCFPHIFNRTTNHEEKYSLAPVLRGEGGVRGLPYAPKTPHPQTPLPGVPGRGEPEFKSLRDLCGTPRPCGPGRGSIGPSGLLRSEPRPTSASRSNLKTKKRVNGVEWHTLHSVSSDESGAVKLGKGDCSSLRTIRSDVNEINPSLGVMSFKIIELSDSLAI